MPMNTIELNQLSYNIIGCAYQVHKALGPGLLESTYETCLCYELEQKGLHYERQKGICVHCGKHFELEEMEADHIIPWKEGGTTVAENCQMLCRNCNRIKGGK